MKIITLILFVFTCRFCSCVEPGGNTGTGSGRSATGGRPTAPNVNRPAGLPPTQGAGSPAGSNVSRGGTSSLGSTSGGITGSPAQSRLPQGTLPSTRPGLTSGTTASTTPRIGDTQQGTKLEPTLTTQSTVLGEKTKQLSKDLQSRLPQGSTTLFNKPGQTSGTTASTIPRIGATPSRGLTTTTPSTPLLRSGATQDNITGGPKPGTSLGHTPGTPINLPGLSTGTTAPGLRSDLGNTLANRNLQGLSNDNVQRPSSQLPSRLSQGSTLGSGLGQKSTTSFISGSSTSPLSRFGQTQQTSTSALFNRPGVSSGAGSTTSTLRIGDTPTRGLTGSTPLLQSSSSLGPKKTPISTVASSLGATSKPSLPPGTPSTLTKPSLTGESSKGPLSTQETASITPSKTKPGQESGTKTVELSTLEPEDLGEDLEEDLQPTRDSIQDSGVTLDLTPIQKDDKMIPPGQKPPELEVIPEMDMSSVDVKESTESGLSTLIYTTKDNATVPALVYDKKFVWKSIDGMCTKDSLMKATVYLKANTPVVATLTYKRTTEKTVKEFCKLIKDKWSFVDKTSLQRSFEEELDGNSDNLTATAYKSKVDQTLFTIEEAKHDKVPVLNCTPKDGKKVDKLVYDGNVIWKAEDGQYCSSATFYFGKSGIIGISFTYTSKNDNVYDCFRVYTSNTWQGANGDYYEKILQEARAHAVQVKPETAISTGQQIKPQTSVPTGQPAGQTKPEAKVDTGPFTVVYGRDGTVSIVKYTINPYASKLTYGSETIWTDSKKVCTSATIYLDGASPKLALLKTKEKNKNEETTGRYYDKGKWKNYKEKDHKKKLDELKKSIDTRNQQYMQKLIASTVDIARVDATKYQSFDYTIDTVPIKMLIPKDDSEVTRLVENDTYVWSTEHGKCTIIMLYLKDNKPVILYIVRFLKGKTYGSLYKKSDGIWIEAGGFDDEFKNIRTPPQSSSSFSLDLSLTQDTNQCKIFQFQLYGIDTRLYSPQNANYATMVKHGQQDVWKAGDGERCTFATLYLKDGQDYLFRITIKNARHRSTMKHFEKVGNEWKTTDKDDFTAKRDSLKSDVYRQGKGTTPKPTPSRPTPQSKPQETVLDIKNLNAQAYKCFDYSLDDVLTRLIVATGKKPNKIVLGQEIVWVSDDGIPCNYCTVHMKDYEPTLVYISRDSSPLSLLKTNDGWISADYTKEFPKLRVPFSSSVNFIIDLSATQDTGNCTIFTTPFGKVNTRFYVPKNGHYAKEIKDGGKSVWKSDRGRAVMARLYPSDNPTLLHILSRDTIDTFEHNYLIKSGNKWDTIDKYTHDRLLHGLKNTEPGEQTDLTKLRRELMNSQALLDKLMESVKLTESTESMDANTLDILHYEESTVLAVTNCTLDGYPTTVFIPGKDDITKVVYGTLTIWKGTNNEKCKYLMVHHVYNTPAFAYLLVESNPDKDLYFANKGDKWEIIQTNYIDKFSELNKDTPPSGDYTIDIKKPVSNDKCKVYTYTIDGLLTYSYYPRQEVTVKKIMEGNKVLWDGNKDTKCLYLAVTYDGDKPAMVYLATLKNKDVGYVHKKDDGKGKWTDSDCKGYEAISKKQTETTQVSDKRQDRLQKVANVKTKSKKYVINVEERYPQEKYKVIKTSIDTIPALVYVPGPFFQLTKAILKNENFDLILEKDLFLGLLVYLQDNAPSLVYISRMYDQNPVQNYLDFKTQVALNVSDVTKLKSHQHSQTIFSLDISRKGTDKCKFISFRHSGTLAHSHIIKTEYTCNMVTDGPLVLWIAAKGEKCIQTLTYFLGISPVLLDILARDSDGKLEHYYFYNAGEWTVINNLDYKGILDDLIDVTKTRLSKSIKKDDKETLTLDVAKVDVTKFTMETTKLKVLTSIKYIPSETGRVTKVFFGNDSLWQTLKAGVQCNFAIITYKGISIELLQLSIMDGYEKYMHFGMEDGRLSSITSDEYNEALSTLDSGDGTSDEDYDFIISTTDTLDLLKPIEVDFEVDKFRLDSLSSVVYLSLPKHTIGEVVLTTPLWTCDKDECLNVSVFSTKDTIQLVKIVTKNETLHFGLVNGKMTKVSQKDYDTMFEKLDCKQVDQASFYTPVEVPESPNTITLDISQRLDSRLNTYTGTFKSLSYTTFSTDKTVVDKISSSRLTVWESKDDEVCVYGRLYLDDGPKLLKIRTVGKNGSTVLYFTLDGGRWISLSSDVFSDRLVNLASKSTSLTTMTTTLDGYYEYTLDLSRYNLDSRFNTGFMNYEGRRGVVCTPKNGVIKRVMQGSVLIWTPTSDDYYATMVLLSHDTYLYIFVHSSFNLPHILFYHLNKDTWTLVNYEPISTDITKTSPIPSFKLTLNISGKHDVDKYRVFKMDINGVTTTIFITIYGYNFDKVVSNANLIWKSGDNEECKYLMYHERANKNSFLTLFIDYLGGSKYMVYELRDKWTFSHQLLGPRSLDYKTLQPITFDINTTPKNIGSCDTVFNGIVNKAYSPEPGYYIDEVKDGQTTVWSTEKKEQCLFILSIPGTTAQKNAQSTVSLLSLFFRDEDYCGFKHFEKGTDGWKQIDERGYDKRLIEKRPATNTTVTDDTPQYIHGVVLDTSKVDTDKVDVHEDSLNVTRHSYSAKNGHYFNDFLYDGHSVWKSDKDKCLNVTIYGMDELHCRLDVLSSDVMTSKYYSRKDGNWTSTNHKTFHDWLRNSVNTSRVKLTLDSIDTNLFDIFRYTQNGYEILYGRPLPGYVLTSVVDTTEIWEAGHNQHATEFQLTTIGDYKLLSIINQSYQGENLCFLNSYNSWTPIDEDVYDQYLVPVNESGKVEDVKLDVESPDWKIVTGHKDEMDKMTIQKYTPHLGHNVNIVVFGDSGIWSKKNDDERCLSAEHITKDGTSFIKLLLKIGNYFEHRYFTKEANDWNIITKVQFIERLGVPEIRFNIKPTEETGSTSANTHTLDISGTVDTDKITTKEILYEAVKSVTHAPKFSTEISKVLDSDTIVWVGSSGQRCVTAVMSSRDGYHSLISLSISLSDTEIRYKYLIKKDKEWYLIRKIKYDELLMKMCRQSTPVHTTAAAGEPVTLDILNPDQCKVHAYNYTYNDVLYKAYAPKNDKVILESMEDKNSIWKANGSEKCINAWTYSAGNFSLCRLDILSSSIITPHYFDKRSDLWVSLDYTRFPGKLEGLLNNGSIKLMIDGSGISRDTCNVFEYVEDRYLTTTIIPKFRTMSVNDGKNIWESSDDKDCTTVQFHSDNTDFLSSIYVNDSGKTDRLYFEHCDEKWRTIGFDEFSVFRGELGAYFPMELIDSRTLVDATLDIAKVDTSTFRTYSYQHPTISHFEYTPIPNCKVIKVVNGTNESIWQGDDKERCLSCEVYSKEGHSPIIALYVKREFKFEWRYIEYNDQWNEIDDKTFNNKLTALKNISRLQLLKYRMMEYESGKFDIFERRSSYTSYEINVLYLNQWLLSHVPHWILEQLKTLYTK